jgi:hypothetical protein
MAKIHPWALGIGIVVIAFPLAILTMAFFAGTADTNMVTDNYYEKDKNYQRRIDIDSRTEKLERKPEIRYDAAMKSCVVRFTDSSAARDITGNIHLFRSADAGADVVVPIRLDGRGRQALPMSGRPAGAWLVKLSWKQNGLDYFLEQRIHIN